MASGTSAGLLDSPRAQSVFKHGILKRYMLPFAVMTAAPLSPRRSVLVDGFAGRGRFDGGAAASAEHLMIQAQKARPRTQVDVFLVERNRSDFLKLDAVADEYRGRGLNVEVRHGDVEDYLDEIGEYAEGASLFLFLDPCGANIPYDELTGMLKKWRSAEWPRTEVLLNFSADLIRRYAGRLHKQGAAADTDRVDVMCGGDWWQQVALDAHARAGGDSWTVAADAVVEEYARRVSKAFGSGWAYTEVRRKQHHEPVYYLVFLTHDPHGFWVFGDAHAKARYDWLKHLAEEADDGQLTLVDAFDAGELEKTEQAEAKKTIRRNLETLMAKKRDFVPIRQFSIFLEDIFGEALEKTAHAVLREAVRDGELKVITEHKKGYGRTYRPISSDS